MTDQWYMRRYSDSVPYIKKLTDKVFTSAQRFISGSFGIGNANDYTDMDYCWSLTWSCAGDQIKYGTEHFYEERYDAASFEEFCDIVREHNIQTGDVIYQSPANIHHVVIISKITDDGTVYIASHNPPLFDKELNEDFWKKGGFSGGAAVLKVKDQLH